MTFGLAMYFAWAVASVAVYGVVFKRARERLHLHRDRRSRTEYYIATALLMTALSVLIGLVLNVLQAGFILRFGFSALALGAFLGCGIIILLELPREKG